jgi:hypothetical protein
MRVAIPSAVVLFACAGVAYAALHPVKVHPGKSDRLQTGPGHFAIEEFNPATARPTAQPIFRPHRDDSKARDLFPNGEPLKPQPKPREEKLTWNTGAPPPFIPAECPAPCKAVSAEIKKLLDVTGRTMPGVAPPRNTTFVQAVVEEAKRELMW